MSNTWLTVTFPDEETLRAAVEAVAAVVSTEGATDESTPAYRAERVLDAALLAVEETQADQDAVDRAEAEAFQASPAYDGAEEPPGATAPDLARPMTRDEALGVIDGSRKALGILRSLRGLSAALGTPTYAVDDAIAGLDRGAQITAQAVLGQQARPLP